MSREQGMNEKAAEMIAQEAMAQICQKGLLDLPRHSPENVKEIQLSIQSGVFLGMRYMQEACAKKIEEGLGRIPEGMPSFIAAQAEKAFRTLAQVIRETHVTMPTVLTTLPVGKKLDYTTATKEEVEAVTQHAAKKAARERMTSLPHQAQYECRWCKEAELPEAECMKDGFPASTDFYGRPLCKECTDRLEPPPKRMPPTP